MSLAADIAKRMLERRKQGAGAKAPTAPTKVAPKAPAPAQAAKTPGVIRTAPPSAKSAEPVGESVGERPPISKHLITPPRPQPLETPRERGPGLRLSPARPDQGPKLRSAPYVPPVRTEPDIIEVLRSLPEIVDPGDESLPPLPALAPGFRGSCKAINPATGRQCALLAHHTKPHRHGNTEFLYAAAPNQQSFHRRDLIDQAATRSNPEAS